MPRYAFAYARASTDEQAEKGLTIPAQFAEIDKFAETEDIVILARYKDEGKSAYKDDACRTDFWRMVEDAKKDRRVTLIIVHESSRFYRRKYKAAAVKGELLEYGVTVITASNKYDPRTIQGKWQESIDETKDETHSMEIAQWTMRAMKQNVATRDPETGYCYKNGGRPPFGYKRVKVHRGVTSRGKDIWKILWEIEPRQAEALRFILVELGLQKRLAYDRIRDAVNSMRAPTGELVYPSPSGGIWGTSTIVEMFRPERIETAAGTAFWNKEDHHTRGRRFKPREEWVRIENAHPAIITQEECQALLALQAERRKEYGWPKADRNRWLLTGKNLLGEPMFICAYCNANVIGMQETGRNKPKYGCGSIQYRGKDACYDTFRVEKEWLEEQIINRIRQRYLSTEEINKLVTEVNRVIAERTRGYEKTEAEIQKQLRAKTMAIESLLDSLEAALADYERKALIERIAKREAEKAVLERQLVELKKEKPTVKPLDREKVLEYRRQFDKIIADGPNAEKKKYLSLFVHRLTLDPVKKEILVSFYSRPLERETVGYSFGARDET